MVDRARGEFAVCNAAHADSSIGAGGEQSLSIDTEQDFFHAPGVLNRKKWFSRICIPNDGTVIRTGGGNFTFVRAERGEKHLVRMVQRRDYQFACLRAPQARGLIGACGQDFGAISIELAMM